MRIPPKRKPGQGRGPRSLDGELLDLRTTAKVYGGTEAFWRCRIGRGEVPFRKLGGRIVILRKELDALISNLPGLSLEGVLEIERKRRGEVA